MNQVHEKKSITNQKQRDFLKEYIQMELLKRGISARILYLIENGKNKIELQTETIPVIFKSLKCETIHSWIIHIENNIYRITINIDCSYKTFSGDTNIIKLFDVSGKIQIGESEVFELFSIS